MFHFKNDWFVDYYLWISIFLLQRLFSFSCFFHKFLKRKIAVKIILITTDFSFDMNDWQLYLQNFTQNSLRYFALNVQVLVFWDLFAAVWSTQFKTRHRLSKLYMSAVSKPISWILYKAIIIVNMQLAFRLICLNTLLS